MMYSVSRLARRFCATLATVPTKISSEAFASSHVTVKKNELIRYAKDLRKFRQPQRALEIFELMERKEIAFSGRDHAIRLDLIAKTKGLEAAENYFNSLDASTKNQSTYESLLNCYCVEHEEEKAKAHFDNMVDLNHVSTSLPFNKLMAMYLKLGQPEKVHGLVVAMKQKNISPCDITYSMWIRSLNDVDRVEKVLEEMKAQGKSISSWDTFANLATIYINVGLYEKAEEVLKSIEKKMNPGQLRDSYHFLITSYAGISKASEVYRVWGLLKKKYPNVNNTSCLTMLQALSKLNDIDGFTKFFTEWETTCWTYDTRMANVAIRSYLKQNMYYEAEVVMNGAIKKARQLLMMQLLNNDQEDLPVKHFEEILDHEMKWTWRSELIRPFFLHFEETKDVDGAENFCSFMWTPLDSETYTLLMKTYLAAGKACPNMKKRLAQDGIEVDEEKEGLLRKICP